MKDLHEGDVIRGPWGGEDIDFIDSIEDQIEQRLIEIHGSEENIPAGYLEGLNRIAEILDAMFRSGGGRPF